MLTSAVAALALIGAKRLAAARAAEAPTPLAYVGSAVCAGRHQSDAKLWDRSHHQVAMASAAHYAVLSARRLERKWGGWRAARGRRLRSRDAWLRPEQRACRTHANLSSSNVGLARSSLADPI